MIEVNNFLVLVVPYKMIPNYDYKILVMNIGIIITCFSSESASPASLNRLDLYFTFDV